LADVARALDDADDAEPPAPDDLELAALPWNDLGNAERLLARHGHDMVYIERVGMHVWDGMRWNVDGGDFEAQKRAHATVKKLDDEAAALVKPAKDAMDAALAAYREVKAAKPAKAAPDAEKAAYALRFVEVQAAAADAVDAWKSANKMTGFAVQSGNTPKLKGLVEQAKPYLRRHPREMNTDPFALATPNGTLRLMRAKRGGAGAASTIVEPPKVTLHGFRRRDLITKLAGVGFEPAAAAPTWDRVVVRALPDAAVRGFVQRFFGYCLTGSITEQVMMICFGTGKNAKTTIIETVAEALGELAVTVPFATFVEQPNKRAGDHTPELVRMVGARLVTASEPNLQDRLSEGTIKTVTGGERITAREMFERQFEFVPAFKVVVSCNFKPSIKGQDDGIWRRVLLTPFLVKIPDAEQDRDLRDKLRAELPGVLRWLVDGYLAWAERGLDVPTAVREATDEYRRESDPIGEFLRSCTNGRPDSVVQASALYRVYVAWCRASAIDPISQTMFGRKLSDRGVERDKSSIKVYRNREFSTVGLEFVEAMKRASGPDDPAARAADAGPPAGFAERDEPLL
jgi:putative DNA primase/helicase